MSKYLLYLVLRRICLLFFAQTVKGVEVFVTLRICYQVPVFVFRTNRKGGVETLSRV